jgi:Integrase core domain
LAGSLTRLASTGPLLDDKGRTAAAFLARANAWFAAHGIAHIHRVVTDNGACYGSNDFARIVGKRTRHQKTRPFTPRHNGNVERYQRTLAEEVLYARPYDSEDERSAAIGVWTIHYNYHRPHSAVGGQPPATRPSNPPTPRPCLVSAIVVWTQADRNLGADPSHVELLCHGFLPLTARPRSRHVRSMSWDGVGCAWSVTVQSPRRWAHGTPEAQVSDETGAVDFKGTDVI